MIWHFTPSILLFLLSGSISLMAAILNWRLRQQPGFAKLALIMLLVSLWTFADGFQLSIISLEAKWYLHLFESSLIWLFNTLIVPFICEIYQYKWLTRPRFVLLFFIPGVFQLFEWTNPFHHLVWTGYSLYPANPDILIVSYGPLFYIELIYLVLLSVACVLLLTNEMGRSKGWKRLTAGLMALSISVPYLAYWGYTLLPGDILGISLMPIGYSVSGLAISWVVFEDLQRTIQAQTSLMRGNILELEAEISRRKVLEKNLLDFQDSLAQQMSDQTRKLSGLYEMILLSGQSLSMQDLLDQSLARIRVMLGCELVCFYDLSQASPTASFAGPQVFEPGQAPIFRFEWMGQGQDVIAHVQGRLTNPLPDEVRQAGFKACAGKRVKIKNENLGIFACYWKDLHQFRVEEISLIGALSEELGVVLENARLRELISMEATQHERRRLARELHDSVVQSLHSLVFTASTARQAAVSKPEKLAEILELIATSAQLALQEMRLLLYELRLIPSEEILFLDGLQSRLDAVERRANIEAELQVESGSSWPKGWNQDLYALSIEALNNSLKHAHATRVEIQLAGHEHKFELKIRDNGKGFNLGSISLGGMGLSTMAERAERLGGRLVIDSAPGAGTLIQLVIDESIDLNPTGDESL